MASDDERPTVPSLSGIALRDLRWALEECFGAEAMQRALARVAPEIREQYDGAFALSWIPYDVLTEVHEALAEEAGVHVDEMVERAVPLAVERSLKTVWRIFMRLTSDAALIKRTPLVYARSRSHGQMTARLIAPGQSETLVTGFPEIPDRDIASLRVTAKRFLELAGRRDVEVTAERTPDGARFLSRFRP